VFVVLSMITVIHLVVFFYQFVFIEKIVSTATFGLQSFAEIAGKPMRIEDTIGLA